jgi:hypothetical protein
MTPREIIAEAWALTLREKKLRRWGCLSSFFQTLLTLKLLGYQAYFLYAYTSGKQVGLFDDFEYLYGHLPLWLFITIGVSFLLLLLVEFVLPNMALGAIIGLAAKSHKKEEVKGGLVLALFNFFPILAIHEFLVLSGWATVLSLSSMTARYIDGDAKFFIIGILVIFWLLSNVLKFFFSFAQPAVVIQRAGIFEAMGQSFKLIVSYLGQIVFLLLLLMVISLRIVLNVVIIVLIPAIMVGLGLLLTYFLSTTLSYIITGAVGVILVGVASYFFGYLEVFKEAVWTIMYIELKKNKDLDHIE